MVTRATTDVHKRAKKPIFTKKWEQYHIKHHTIPAIGPLRIPQGGLQPGARQ
jgi:hypothetical protein